VTRSFPARQKDSGWCSLLSSSMVYPFLPTSFFMGFSLFMAYNYISFRPTLFFTLPALSPSAKPSLALILIGDYGSTSFISIALYPRRKFMMLGCHHICAPRISVFEGQYGWFSAELESEMVLY
jgi:hypothetical protein